MLVLGIILILAALTAIGYLWFGTQGEPAIDIDLGAFTAALTPLQIFLLGAGCLLLLTLGVMLTLFGMRGRVKRRREVRALREQVRSQERTAGAPRNDRADRDRDRERDLDRDAADRAAADSTSGRVVDYEREVTPPPPPDAPGAGRAVTGPQDGDQGGAAGGGSDIDPSRFRP